MKVKIKKLYEDVIIPEKGSEGAYCWDLRAYTKEEIHVPPHSTRFINTGIAVAIEPGYCMKLYPRSGISSKRGLMLANCTGIIDEDYRGEILVALHNLTDVPSTIIPNEKIAQFSFEKKIDAEFVFVDELDGTVRGDGGFGHSGRI